MIWSSLFHASLFTCDRTWLVGMKMRPKVSNRYVSSPWVWKVHYTLEKSVRRDSFTISGTSRTGWKGDAGRNYCLCQMLWQYNKYSITQIKRSPTLKWLHSWAEICISAISILATYYLLIKYKYRCTHSTVKKLPQGRSASSSHYLPISFL